MISNAHSHDPFQAFFLVIVLTSATLFDHLFVKGVAAAAIAFEFPADQPYLLNTYSCVTTINTWLRPVEEDLSMSACLEHSSSNL
jgi:hypothetical protein